MKNNHKKLIIDYMSIAAGCFVLSVAVNSFLLPNKISAGGISGVGTVLQYIFKIKLSVTNLVLNALLFLFGCKLLDRHTIIRTVYGVILFSVFLELGTFAPVYTESMMVASASGGVLMGAGLGMVMRAGGSTGGSDFAGIIIKRFFPHISLAKSVMLIDCAVVLLSGIVFKSFTVTFYSVAALLVCEAVNDKIITAGDDAKVIWIFSKNPIATADYILKSCGRGVTGIQSVGMFEKRRGLMLMCVVTPKELPHCLRIIKEKDKNAFVVIGNVHEVIGEGFKNFNG